MYLSKHIRLGSKAFKAGFYTLVIGMFFLFTQILLCEDTGRKFIKNYSPEEYNHLAQNWGIAQADNGIIYVANHGGVLEFDGVSWRQIYLDDHTLCSLAIDKNRTLYLGGTNEIWYLTPDSAGSLKYVSLLDNIPDQYKNFGTVWSTHATKEGIFFRTTTYLFRWNYKKMKIWKTSSDFKASFVYNGGLVLQEGERGFIMVLKNKLQPMPGGEIFAGKKVPLFVPYDKHNTGGKRIAGNQSKGFFLYDGIKAEPFPIEKKLADYLKKHRLYQGIRLTSGDYALATRGGLIIMTPGGHLKSKFDRTYGLQDSDVKNVFQDTGGNLWLCLSKGVSKIEYTSPLSIHDHRSDLPGLILSVTRHSVSGSAINSLYVGTTNGLFILESPLKFRAVPGISGSCSSLLSIKDSIFAATTGGVFQYNHKINRKIIHNAAYALHYSAHTPNRIFCGTISGLVVLDRKNGIWRKVHRFTGIKQKIHSITQDKNGHVWLGTLNGNIFRVQFPVNGKPVLTRYNASHGVPEKEIFAAPIAGHITFATTKGLFLFNETNERFVPDLTLGSKYGDGSTHVFRIREDQYKNIWFQSKSRNYRATPQGDRTYKIEGKPFRRLPKTAQVNTIYPDPGKKIIWFASHLGLIRYDTTMKKNHWQEFPVLIRKVLVNEKQVDEIRIFDGFVNKNSESGKDLFSILKYKDRNLYFEFAAPFFEAESETQYRYFLDGYDNNWSAWGKESKKYYTNLNSGAYTFRVRARNVYQHEGREDAFGFRVLPPWYYTWWAIIIYVILFLGLVVLAAKWWSGRLEQEKQRLEQVVIERTKEVYHKNELLEEQSEALKEMDRVKSRFFANISHEFRTPLTLILSPLEQMLAHSRDKRQKRELNVMLRNSQRLLTLINQLLDLASIDSGKMKLVPARQNIVSFLREIQTSFTLLIQRNRLSLEFHCSEENITFYFDVQKIEEMMCNLLINAVKFTPAGGKIKVSVSRAPETLEGYVEITVGDTGIGISREQIIHIFDRFYQAEKSNEKNRKGTGIGLALSKEIVTLHGGTIDAHSREGEGTKFVIRLPLVHFSDNEIQSENQPEPQRLIELQTHHIHEITPEEEKEGEHEWEQDGTREEGEEKPLILVVEDNREMRQYVKSPMEESGYRVVEAEDGKEGIEKAMEMIPDLIVSDIMMPGTDGYELCTVLKKNVNTSHIPIILLTAKASEKSEIQGLQTGADDYVTKPFNSRILLMRIRNMIELRHQLQMKIQRRKMFLPEEITVSSVDDRFLKEFYGIIEDNLADMELNIDMLCQKLLMGRSTLFRKIRALTGETPNQFILSYRLERAARLLRGNFGNITEVAMEVGFSSPQYFSQCFKEKFHMSPKTFNQQAAGPD